MNELRSLWSGHVGEGLSISQAVMVTNDLRPQRCKFVLAL